MNKGWPCTECGGKTRVMDSRCRESATVPFGQMVRRRRQCTVCFKKQTTHEIVLDMEYVKRLDDLRRALIDLSERIIQEMARDD